jgi:TonB-linked SusC/RagA family outer membrane protein
MRFFNTQNPRKSVRSTFFLKGAKGIIVFILVLNCSAAHAYSFTSLIISANKEVTIQKTIKGKIVDENRVPIPGANVLIKGTKTGVQTDVDGNFSIEVQTASTVLVISFIGMEDQEVLAGNTPLTIVLKSNEQKLSEVVVVGYSSIKRQSLTGALQTIDNKKLTDVTTPSVENLLAGKISGVFVSSGSGQPGESGKIIIRGKTTVNGSNDPLWVVDGVIIGNNATGINPTDIETMTILKDAASTAMYGSQGANGVILVTTKSGKSGKAVINFSTKMAATTLNTGNFSLMNGTELYDLYNSFSNKQDFSTAWWWTPELRNKNFDWWQNATTTGLAKDHNLSISGGNESLKSYVSIGMYDETSAIKGLDYKRYSTLLKFIYKTNSWLTVRPQISATLVDVFDKQHSVGAMYGNMPWDYPYLKEGTLVGNQPNPTWVNTTGDNYLYDLQWNYGE